MSNPNPSLVAISLFFLLGFAICASNVTKTKVSGYWELRVHSCTNTTLNGQVFNVTVPSVLHLVLLMHGKISDPFFGNNYPSLNWVSSCNITYSKNITFSESTNTREIVFEGIDTYSTIKFNGKTMQNTNNSFVEYRIVLNETQIKKDKANLLQIQLFSSNRVDENENRKNRMPFAYAQSRKAAYQYSWDWAPYLNTIGIWKNVYILEYPQARIDYVWIRNKQIKKQSALLNFAIAFVGQKINQRHKVVIEHPQIKSSTWQLVSDQIYVDVLINNPTLWWPNGIGQQNLYNFTVKLLHSDSVIEQIHVLYGIRTVQLNAVNNKFTVTVNGHQIYCKGANYVPTDMFYPRGSNPDFKPGYTYEKLINDAVDSHFNMIRVWGGGQYESDQFLELASRKGIMIFYDFMFSDSIYPSTPEFMRNVEKEVTHQVRRTRNYPCLVLWSGNNQILQGIQSWGWSAANYQKDYERLFKTLIPAILKKQDPDIPYIASSPSNGVGNGGFQRGGDVHYWGVWAAGAPFEAYISAVGFFNSQFGTQGIPVWETVLNFTTPSGRSYDSQQFGAHERHNSHFSTLRRYIKQYAHESKDFEHEVYLSGLIQAFGVQIAIRSQRSAKPKSMGTLYWQMNDAWPAISWSSIDYFGRWKPLQYMAKRLYPDVAIFCAEGKIRVINDNLYPVNALAYVVVQNFNGTLQLNQKINVQLQPNENKLIQTISKNDYLQKLGEVVVYTEIIAGRQKHMSSTYFFVPFKDLKLDPSSKLFVKLHKQSRTLIIHTDKFIKNLYISSKTEYLKLSDNYFDMMALKIYKVQIDTAYKNYDKILQDIRFRSYVQIHSNSELQVIFQS